MAERRRKILGVVGLYDDVDSLLHAAETIRDSGHAKWDCHTPYPVHGLDRAMGLGASRVAWVTLSAGLVGFLTAVALTGGLSVFQYPIRIGGKALFSWQAFVPIYFELFVLFSAVATMAAVIGFCRLGIWHSPLHDSGVMQEVSCDRFAIALESGDESQADDHLERMLRETGCRDIRPLVQFEEEDGPIL